MLEVGIICLGCREVVEWECLAEVEWAWAAEMTPEEILLAGDQGLLKWEAMACPERVEVWLLMGVHFLVCQ